MSLPADPRLLIDIGVSGSRPGLPSANGLSASPLAFDDLSGEYGLSVYREMMRDSAVGAGLGILTALVLGVPGSLQPGITRDDDPRYQEAQEALEFCEAALDVLSTPLQLVLEQMLEALAVKSAPAEVTYRPWVWRGQSRLIIDRIDPKPREAVAYIEDQFGRRRGYTLRQPGQPLVQQMADPADLLPLEKVFCIEFPRSVLRGAYNWYQFGLRVMPEWYRYLQTSAAPSLVGFAGQPQTLSALTGPPESTQPVSPERLMLLKLQQLQNASAAVFGPMDKVELIEAKGDGSQFEKALEYCDKKVLMGVLGAFQSVAEAKHSSKASSETSAALLLRAINLSRQRVAHAVTRQLIWPLCRFNFRDAEEIAPKWQLQASVSEDFAQMSEAFSRLQAAGLLDDSVMPWADAILGIPGRDYEAMAARREDRQAEDDARRIELGKLSDPQAS